MKFAAIDIGSNAVRLLLSQVFENGKNPIFKKESLIRIPIRLGEDTFKMQYISDTKVKKLTRTLIAFKYLMDTYEPVDYIACATSAMREAKNKNEIVKNIKLNSGISVEIVDGKREAEILYSNHAKQVLDKKKSYLSIDVGGGSTEITIFSNYKVVDANSFNIGTVRVLEQTVPASLRKRMKKWLKKYTMNHRAMVAIGSGGNINKLFRMARIPDGKPITYQKLKSLYEDLVSYSFEDRIRILKMRPDRADVIIPACEIFLSVMNWSKIKKMYVPQIGLADGLVHLLYEKYKQKLEVQKKRDEIQISMPF